MNIQHRYNQVKFYVKKYGIIKTIQKVILKIWHKITSKNTCADTKGAYQLWREKNEPDEKQLEEQRKKQFKINPKISLVVPMYNTPLRFFEELVDCLIDQTYANWELCLADGSPEENKELKRY